MYSPCVLLSLPFEIVSLRDEGSFSIFFQSWPLSRVQRVYCKLEPIWTSLHVTWLLLNEDFIYKTEVRKFLSSCKLFMLINGPCSDKFRFCVLKYSHVLFAWYLKTSPALSSQFYGFWMHSCSLETKYVLFYLQVADFFFTGKIYSNYNLKKNMPLKLK
jgi:hypothetical protein